MQKLIPFQKCLFLFADHWSRLEWLAQIPMPRLYPMPAFLWQIPPKMSKSERESIKLSGYARRNKEKSLLGPLTNYMNIYWKYQITYTLGCKTSFIWGLLKNQEQFWIAWKKIFIVNFICGFSYNKIKQNQKSGGWEKNKSANPLPLLWLFPIPLNISMLCSVGHKITRKFLKTIYNIWPKFALYLKIYNDSFQFFTDYFSPMNPLEILNICSVLWFCLLVCFLENISWFLGWLKSHQSPFKTIIFFFLNLGAPIFFWTEFFRVQFPHMFYLSTLVSCNHSSLCPCSDILAKHKVILWEGHAQKFKNYFFGYHTHMITTRLGINVFITLYKTCRVSAS